MTWIDLVKAVRVSRILDFRTGKARSSSQGNVPLIKVDTARTYEMAGRQLLGLEPLRWVF